MGGRTYQLPLYRKRPDKEFYHAYNQRLASLGTLIGATGNEIYYRDDIYFRKDIQNIWVAEGGNDNWSGTFRQPKATLSGANFIANSNDIINVLPGTYYVEGLFLKSNVNFYLYPNVSLYNTGDDDFMFRVSEHNYVGGIYGNGSIYNTGGIGILKQTGYHSSLEIEGHIMSGGNLNISAGASELFQVNNSGKLKVTCDEISLFRDTPSASLEIFYMPSRGSYIDVFCDKMETNCEFLNGAITITGDFYANFTVDNIIHRNYSNAFVFQVQNMETNIQCFNLISEGCSRFFSVFDSGKLAIDANNFLTKLDDILIYASDYSRVLINADLIKGQVLVNNFFDGTYDPIFYTKGGIWEASGNYVLYISKQDRCYIKDMTIINHYLGGTGIILNNNSIGGFTGFYFIDDCVIGVSGNGCYPISTGRGPKVDDFLMLDLNSCVFSTELPSDLDYSGSYRTNQWIR